DFVPYNSGMSDAQRAAEARVKASAYNGGSDPYASYNYNAPERRRYEENKKMKPDRKAEDVGAIFGGRDGAKREEGDPYAEYQRGLMDKADALYKERQDKLLGRDTTETGVEEKNDKVKISIEGALTALTKEDTGWKGFFAPNKSVDAIKIIDKYDVDIASVAEEYGVPANLIKSVLYREQTFLMPFEDFADQINETSSLGLGQIKAETAIEAENQYSGEYRKSIDNEKDIDEMRKTLANPHKNIEYIAMVLAMEANELGINLLGKELSKEDIAAVFGKYNGSGDSAKKYGEETLRYYNVFSN
ncbi:MAG: hypothetical protein RR413_12485, partial [Christensenellaceae bacterium]